MQICHVNTREYVDLLPKISKRDIQYGDQKIVPMKYSKQFLIAREKIRVLYPVFFCTLEAILVCILSASIIYLDSTLRKHAYSNVLKILQPKKETFKIKHSDAFHIPAQNIDDGYSLEPPRRGGLTSTHSLCF